MTKQEQLDGVESYIRGMARSSLCEGVDHGQVAFAMAREARLSGLPEATLSKIVQELRDEGLFPPVPERDETLPSLGG